MKERFVKLCDDDDDGVMMMTMMQSVNVKILARVRHQGPCEN